MSILKPHTTAVAQCYHCGEACVDTKVVADGQAFCCSGCKLVYEILNENDLCAYYDLNTHPGQGQIANFREDKFTFLDNDDIKSKLITFSDNEKTHLTLFLPQMHCSSCIWLLENITKLNAGINYASVNFSEKEIYIIYEQKVTTLRKVVETLASIGYEPQLSLNELGAKNTNKLDRTRWYKIGVAGFCFANIMMLSVPDYVTFGGTIEPLIATFFKTITLLLSLPVVFYSSTEFFESAWKSLKQRYLNIDFPVALAIAITFLRSLYEIFTHTGGGYLDSMSGIVFFMLIGRWLQSRTYQAINFDRDYKSFFPIAVNLVKDDKTTPVEINKVAVNDIIRLHSNEILPVDGILSRGRGNIDYSFVTGESNQVDVNIGEIVYAGGKQKGGSIEILVTKAVSQSYLTNLWNNPIFHPKTETKANIYDQISKHFTNLVLLIGLSAGLYWFDKGEIHLMWNAMTTVLIVACPCALLLSKSFTQGNVLKIFSLQKLYLRSADVIDGLSKINHIVLDKTGTLTEENTNNIAYHGEAINAEDKKRVASLLSQSLHPYSKAIVDLLDIKSVEEIQDYKEVPGAGIEGWIDERYIKIGSSVFVGNSKIYDTQGSMVYIKIDQQILGAFTIKNKYRQGVPRLLAELKADYPIAILSGDNDQEAHFIKTMLGDDNEILFNQSPFEKLTKITSLMNDQHKNVAMVGDGLNDAGALKQANVGIAIANQTHNFTPASDAIIDAHSLVLLPRFIKFAKISQRIIIGTFIYSSIYNIIGLYYAAQGILSPVIAAVLMPLSSVSIILISYFWVHWIGSQYFKTEQTK